MTFLEPLLVVCHARDFQTSGGQKNSNPNCVFCLPISECGDRQEFHFISYVTRGRPAENGDQTEAMRILIWQPHTQATHYTTYM